MADEARLTQQYIEVAGQPSTQPAARITQLYVEVAYLDSGVTTTPGTTLAPTTLAPTTSAPTTSGPTTSAPTTQAPTVAPTTAPPSTLPPCGAIPSLVYSSVKSSSLGIVRNYRTLIQTYMWSDPGCIPQYVRVRFKAGSGNLYIAGASIGQRKSIEQPSFMLAGTLARLTFNSGNNSITVGAGEQVWSDWIPYIVDFTKAYLVHLSITDDNSGFVAYSTGSSSYYKSTSDDECLVYEPAGYSSSSSHYSVTGVEVVGELYITTSAPTLAPTTSIPTTSGPTTVAPTTLVPTTSPPTTLFTCFKELESDIVDLITFNSTITSLIALDSTISREVPLRGDICW